MTSLNETGPECRLVVIAPVFQDAASAGRLLEELVGHFQGTGMQLHILLLDDGSQPPLSNELRVGGTVRDCVVEILRLRRNVGHQRAIALGTAYVHDRVPCDAMLVMDADGEDRPRDAVRLVEQYLRLRGRKIVFAERTRRSESRLFLVLYRLYQLMHWLLTGIRVRVGNFSVVPADFLPTLVTVPEMWNHYAAAVFQSRLPFTMIPTERGPRYSGSSKMNYLSLIMHGLHAISVFSALVAVRLLLAVFALSCVCGSLLLGSLFTPWRSAPGLAVGGFYGWGAFALLVLLTLACFSLVLSLLSQRNTLNFIPVRDYKYFVESLLRVKPAPAWAQLAEFPKPLATFPPETLAAAFEARHDREIGHGFEIEG